jgi:hypothetical protein
MDAQQSRERIDDARLNERTAAETALPKTSAMRGAGLTIYRCRTPRSRSQIAAMP